MILTNIVKEQQGFLTRIRLISIFPIYLSIIFATRIYQHVPPKLIMLLSQNLYSLRRALAIITPSTTCQKHQQPQVVAVKMTNTPHIEFRLRILRNNGAFRKVRTYFCQIEDRFVNHDLIKDMSEIDTFYTKKVLFLLNVLFFN